MQSKKLLLSMLCAGTLAAIGQQKTSNTLPEITNAPGTLIGQQVEVPPHMGSNPFRDSQWLNYAQDLDDLNGGIASGAFMLLFPDSLPIVGQFSDGTTARPQFMHAATMLDPKNMLFPFISDIEPYTIDSLEIGYAYLRNTASSVEDTIVVSFIRENDALLWQLSGSGQIYQDFLYDQPNNRPDQAEVIDEYTIILTENDSSSFASSLFLGTPNVGMLPAGSRVGVSIEFKPGYSYQLDDSLNLYNQFYIFSLEEQGANTDPVYYGVNDLAQVDGNMNVSYALPADVRYATNGNGWNGYYIPTWAWQTGYAYENHYIGFLVNAPTFNTSEQQLEVNMFPNPATDVLNIELINGENAAVQVANTIGQIVLTDEITGSARIDISSLPSGLYLVNVEAQNGMKYTRKITVK